MDVRGGNGAADVSGGLFILAAALSFCFLITAPGNDPSDGPSVSPEGGGSCSSRGSRSARQTSLFIHGAASERSQGGGGAKMLTLTVKVTRWLFEAV